jgi:hypothetical protein
MEENENPQATTMPADDTAATAAVPALDAEYKASDIFAWANNLYQFKEQLQIELFLINKNNVMYRTKLADELDKQLQPLFLNGVLDYVLKGAGEGLVVRGFEDAEAEENVLQRLPWQNVEKLMEVMHWIRTQEEEMELFIEEEHDLKRMKAVLARGTHPALPPFYIIKLLPRAQILKGEGAWMSMNKVFMPMDAATLRIPAGNELLVLEQDLYVFNQQKLDRLFGYNAKKNSIAEKKVEAITSQYKLVFAEGNDMQTLVKGNKPLINKLQKLEISPDIKQENLMTHGEDLGIDLMQDDNGAIIIEDAKDLMKFVNLLNDDYVESLLTGQRYEIKNKKLLKLDDNEEAAL